MTFFRRSLVLFALICAAIPHPRAAKAADETAVNIQEKRETFAKDFARIVISVLHDKKKSYDDRKENLREAFSKSVDIDWIAKFVIGKTWNQATEEQRERYVSLYRKYLTQTYVSNFAENPDKRIVNIDVAGVTNVNDSDFTVRTSMVLANDDNVKVNYLVRENAGKYKVLDIAIENISLINTHRAEFNALAANKGIDAVITTLEAAVKTERPAITLSMK